MAWAQNNISDLHKYILYPTVRLRSIDGVGSGVIFSSATQKDGFADTYIITNYHVISSGISIVDEWNSLTKKIEKKEKRATVEVEIFKYMNVSIATGTLLILADIVEWNKDHDLALVKLRSDELMEPVKKLSKARVNALRIFQPIYVCGAGLGRPPFPTNGQISSLQEELENLPFWMINAPAVFGNSGGGTWLADSLEYIGIPSRISITFLGWSPNAVYHMTYIIPITRIYDWLDETGWSMVYDKDAKTHDEWLEEQKKLEKK